MFIINPKTGAVSTHTATPSHVCEHGGVLYGGGDALVSFDDDPGDLTVTTGRLTSEGLFQAATNTRRDIGTNWARMTIPRVTARCSTADDVIVSYTCDDDGYEQSDGPFILVEGASPKQREWVTSLGRGHRGNAYQFTVSGGISTLAWVALHIESQPRDK